MKKNIQTILFIILFSGSIFGQTPTLEWSKFLAESSFLNLVETMDGNFIIYRKDPTGQIIKINKEGEAIWKINLIEQIEINQVRQLIDGSYLIIGFTNSELVSKFHKNPFNSSGDVCVVKLDINGEIEWQYAYGGYGNDYAHNGYQTTDGGYIIFGATNSNDGDLIRDSKRYDDDVWVLKLSKSGEIEWNKTIGGTGEDRNYWEGIRYENGAYTINVRSNSIDGDFLGYDKSYKMFEFTFNEKGEIIDKTLSDWKTLSTKRTLTNDGNFVSTGMLNDDLVVQKYSPKGEVLWQKTFGEITYREKGAYIYQNSDNNYMVAGSELDGNQSFFLLKLDDSGNLISKNTINGNGYESIGGFYPNSNNTYTAILNSTSTDDVFSNTKGKNDIFILTINKTGEVIGKTNIGGTNNDNVWFVKKTDSSYFLFVYTQSMDYDMTENQFPTGLMMFKFSNNLLSTSSFSTTPISYIPNPVSNQLNLTHTELIKKASVYNYLGQLVLTQNGAENTMQLNVENLPNGSYLVKIESASEAQTVKFVKE